jgi:hypothetical protein
VLVETHDSGRRVTLKSSVPDGLHRAAAATEWQGHVARNGTIVGEVVHDGVGDGHFKLSPIEQAPRQTASDLGGDTAAVRCHEQQQQQQQLLLCSGHFAEAATTELGGPRGSAAELPPECAICLQDFQVGDLISRTGCSQKGHVFHTFCMQEWLKSQATCPLCRQSLAAEPQCVSDPRQFAVPTQDAHWPSYA